MCAFGMILFFYFKLECAQMVVQIVKIDNFTFITYTDEILHNLSICVYSYAIQNYYEAILLENMIDLTNGKYCDMHNVHVTIRYT